MKTDTIRKKTDPLYDSDLEAASAKALGRVAGREEFSFDPNTNALWGAYKKAYAREGARATSDTLGRVSAMTGGTPSSYAVSAAAQAANDYASKLSDKLPDVYGTTMRRLHARTIPRSRRHARRRSRRHRRRRRSATTRRLTGSVLTRRISGRIAHTSCVSGRFRMRLLRRSTAITRGLTHTALTRRDTRRTRTTSGRMNARLRYTN